MNGGIPLADMGATQTLADRTMEQRWDVQQLWAWARSPESPGGSLVMPEESELIYQRTYAADGLDQNVGRMCSLVEFTYRAFSGTKGLESQNFLRSVAGWFKA